MAGAEQWHEAIVFVVFGWVGLSVGELCIFELVGVDEEHRRLDNDVNIIYRYLMYCFHFSGVS